MALWVCAECTTKYAVGLSRCPRCHGTEFHEEGEDMPKVGKHAGPTVEPDSSADSPTPGVVAQADHSPEELSVTESSPESTDRSGAVTSELESPTTTASGTTTKTRRTGGRGST